MERHLLTKDTNPGPTESTINFKNFGGMMSREQNDGLIFTILSLSSCKEIGSKASQETECNNGIEGSI